MVISLFIRHFKIYKNINYIKLSEGVKFSSIIGENGCGKSSILEALDFCFNKKSQEWPINNEAKTEGIGSDSFPYIAPVFLIKKTILKNNLKNDREYYNKAKQLSDFLWNTTHQTKGKYLDDFYLHREELKKKYSTDDYFLLIVGRKHNDTGAYFASFNNQLTFINDKPHQKYEDKELQNYFKGLNEYIYNHYSYIYIPVETDVHTYTKLETLDMQKLMDRSIQDEIKSAITQKTLNQINKDLSIFVNEIEEILGNYHYKGHHKNKLTMPDLISKIIESYFSIKILNKRNEQGKSIPVSELSSGEKRMALIDVVCSFLMKNKDRDSNIILAIDEPEASLHISKCYDQFEKLFLVSKNYHQIIITTHWYGFLPTITNGSATAIKKSPKNEISYKFLNLFNFRENIVHAKKSIRGVLPIDYNIKSYNDLIQSIIHSIMSEKPYNWIICEGISEKIYFDYYFKEEILNNNLRILPVGGFKEVKKIYSYLLTPIKDPDYDISGKVYCLIDTDKEKVEVSEYEKNNNLFFERLLFQNNNLELVEVMSNKINPPTEIEHSLNPVVFYQTLQELCKNHSELEDLLNSKPFNEEAKYSANFLDLTDSEKTTISRFFDDNEGYNKVLFAEKYTELITKNIFKKERNLDWIDQIKNKLRLKTL